jgi:hypothetical protein
MAKKSSPIDPKSKADFDAAIDQFAKDVRVDVSIITNEQMRLMLRDAMTFTPPMPAGGGRGLSVAAHKAGMGKLAKDVKRIFIPMDQPRRSKGIFLRKVINAVQGTGPSGRSWMDFIALQPTEKNINGLSPVMRKIMQDTDTRRAFAKAQNYLNKARADGSMRPIEGPTKDLRGIHDKYKVKVGGRWPKNAPVGGPQYMVGTQALLQAYIENRQLKVGYTKAAWATALRLIPPLISSKGKARNYGVYDAHWVDRNMTAMGQFSMSKTPTGTSMTATNLIGNINNVATEANTVNLVYGNRVKQIANNPESIKARLAETVERANRK